MKPIIVANWKMNTSLDEARSLVTTFKSKLNKISDNIEVVLCPPFVWLYPLSEITKNSQIHLGAQNVFFEENGAYTGEISTQMLEELVKYVIIGHSERKSNLKEDSQMVAKKIKSAIKHNLTPILCIGEKEKIELNDQNPIFRDLDIFTKDLNQDEMKKIIFVYEPIWAISTSQNCQPATGGYASSVIIKMKEYLSNKFTKEIVENINFLYGGSVKSSNAEEFLSQSEIAGALVGAASLKADEFIKICQIAKNLKK